MVRSRERGRRGALVGQVSEATEHAAPLGFRVWRWRCRGPETMRIAHTHADLELNYVMRGQVRYVLGGALARIGPGELGIFWGGIPHQMLEEPDGEGGGGREGIWMTVPVEWLLGWRLAGTITEELLAGALVCEGSGDAAGQAFAATQFERWLAEFKSGERRFREVIALEVEARLRRLALVRCAGGGGGGTGGAAGPGPDDRRLTRFVEIARFLQENYQRDIGAADVAAVVGLHPKYLMQFFKGVSRMTLLDYLLRLRLAHARRLLLTTEMKVLDVALESGFGSLSSFYYAMKRAGVPGGATGRRMRERRA